MRPVVTLTVDDCWETHTRAFKETFETRALRAVFFAIAGFVGKDVNGYRFVDWETLRGLSRNGHEIGSHSLTHRGVGFAFGRRARRFLRLLEKDGILRTAKRVSDAVLTSTQEYGVKHFEQRDEIELSKLRIEEEIGNTCWSYSYPGGEFTPMLKNLVRAAGYASARTTLSGYNHFAALDPYALETKVWDRGVTAKMANGWVDRAIECKLWLVEVFHAVEAHDYVYSASRRALAEHLAYVASKSHEIDNLTIHEAMRRNESLREGP